MADLETAIAIATRAHKGQKDKAGQPYILHPLRVMMSQTSDTARQVAVLHDVVEDTEVTLQFLGETGFSYDVLYAVELLTRKPSENYAEYLRRVMAHPIASAVKRADLEDNMDIRRLPENLQAEDLARLQKYRAAWEVLALAGSVSENPLLKGL
ncbi:conserved hypothetical protein [Magnetococcus marinus MC-1]|uniref:Metal dependent phosphohydrolase n=1 Tax=Magnetococcus marinus (strain ATCC BAA-1437 / JCM 17883 / MC-1) TaxID=156889 RepID=A0L841_MAGMM|nr:HD domain-containing protein [Magnetococcus marinus]ABK44134.1 conserved hypothetical protein [Magnetococcus marinus MC-1]